EKNDPTGAIVNVERVTRGGTAHAYGHAHHAPSRRIGSGVGDAKNECSLRRRIEEVQSVAIPGATEKAAGSVSLPTRVLVGAVSPHQLVLHEDATDAVVNGARIHSSPVSC